MAGVDTVKAVLFVIAWQWSVGYHAHHLQTDSCAAPTAARILSMLSSHATPCCPGGIPYELGPYSTALEAARSYDRYTLLLHGARAQVRWPHAPCQCLLGCNVCEDEPVNACT
jgi:hypothetical protein